MESQSEIRLYLAGPEVFLPNAAEYAERQRELCRKYGFIGLHPMDNNIDITDTSYHTAVKIYRGDVNQIRGCNILVANCKSFRGALIDDGTAYELGFGNALGKPSYGYIDRRTSYGKNLQDCGEALFLCSPQLTDRDGFLVTEDFGTIINLMMQCGMTEHGGRLVHGSFEDCLKAIRDDLTRGILTLE